MDAPARPWIFAPAGSHLRVDESLGRQFLADEADTVRRLLAQARLPNRDARKINRTAIKLVEGMRRNRRDVGGLDAFMSEYDLSSAEGVVLMCLAEALLRIPDADTADRLIADKLGDADWRAHLDRSESLFVNASTWALMLTGRLLREEETAARGLAATLTQAVGRLGEPVIRTALRQAMRILGHQFVMGRTIAEAMQRAGQQGERDYRYSFDMLGEAALTAADAERYLDAYAEAIPVIGADTEVGDDWVAAPGISVKLSALSPRFEVAQSERALGELSARLKQLALVARDSNVALTVDAEEADRLELTLAVFEQVLRSTELVDWSGLGIAVQAYQKRAVFVVGWLADLARARRRVIPVRLVKGAYWDTEIKRAQEQGLEGYPVFTRKSSTDVSYLACAKALLDAGPHLYPQFATHNAHTVAWLLHTGAKQQFEFQRLHGMGQELYAQIIDAAANSRPCRVYAPVGAHEDLLPYLVRRLLENGANTSFVNRFIHEGESAATIVADPVVVTAELDDQLPHPSIPLPVDLFGQERRNSAGINLADGGELDSLAVSLRSAADGDWKTAPIVDGEVAGGDLMQSRDPYAWENPAGTVRYAAADTALAALNAAHSAHTDWSALPARERGAMLRKAAELFESYRPELVARCVREAGRTLTDSLAELREAVDFLRYYAVESERLFAAPLTLRGATGEHNELRLRGRGVCLCISPWNFPLSIFTGQVAAALAAGNTVLAKPAEQAGLVAARAVEILIEAGVPAGALHFLPGEGGAIGAALLPDPRLAGVLFTGSTETANTINRALAERDGPLGFLLAETGGINAMIVDSSALAEQVVRDVVHSAFNSAGQRCSALRLLCLQEDTADDVLRMLIGHMKELVIGDPGLLSTDVGPVIDLEAKRMLTDYVASRSRRILYQCQLTDPQKKGVFFPPTVLEIDRAGDLTEEIFGPVLHVVRYASNEIDAVVDELNDVGYGLTLGIHSRIDSFAENITKRARVGNVYINRNMIGAQVGVQPFGGMGLSGTGPKAGGPHYLTRLVTEQTVTINTAAVGGNATLLSQGA
ncbi:MAG: bifunctional proline dehydrogenase/L-glutamate gamma-semialdehyde dehydrogenase PutA [Gammaproteobacteria bacterium]